MGRPGRLHGTDRWDVVLPLVVAVVAAVELVGLPGSRLAAAATTLPACALLVLRRPLPVVAGGGALALVAVQPLLGVPTDQATAPLGVVFLAGYALGRRAGLAAGLGVLAGTAALVLLVDPDGRVPPGPGDVVFVAAVLLLPWAAGRLVRGQARRTDDADRRALAAAAASEAAAARAVEAERRRIAAELHDVVAHSLSVMLVQAAAAQDLVRPDPDAAVWALGHVQDAGRRALQETATLLHLVRDGGDGAAPVPGAAEVPALVAGFARAGLDVTLEVTADPGADMTRGATSDGSGDGRAGDGLGLPAGIDVSVYRVVEEALTNAVRHASGPVEVRLHRAAGEVQVLVTSHGVRDGALVPSAGLGLTGMRERAQVFGGSLRAGPSGDGFVVEALLPVPGPA